jgi:hypothetical protein
LLDGGLGLVGLVAFRLSRTGSGSVSSASLAAAATSAASPEIDHRADEGEPTTAMRVMPRQRLYQGLFSGMG